LSNHLWKNFSFYNNYFSLKFFSNEKEIM